MQHQALSFSIHLFSIVCSLLSVSAVNSVIYIQCSQLYFTSNKSYALNLNSLFTSMVESASDRNFNTFKVSPPGDLPNDVVYGLSQCRGDLSSPDCGDCVSNSITPLKTTCPLSIGGAIQSEGCLVKYNNTSPFGFEDKTEVFKSCGPSIGYNSDVMNHIDDALAYLVVGNGEYFRSGGSGSVHGVAQCEEDLTPSECDNCILEARARLRSECETSTWGDIHLGKCYIQYADQSIDYDSAYDDNQNKPNNTENHGGKGISITLKLAIITTTLLSLGGVSYYISVTISNKVGKKINAKGDIEEVNVAKKIAKGAVNEAKRAMKKAKEANKVAKEAKIDAEEAKKVAKEVKIEAEFAQRRAVNDLT